MNSIIMHFLRKLWGVWLGLFVILLDLFLTPAMMLHDVDTSYVWGFLVICLIEFGIVLASLVISGIFLDLRAYIIKKWRESVRECRNN